ncbi:SEL1-like repeat protein [Alysiella filiformis]|uniref:Sel1 repeat-containing protein n=1 Tax=Alysiella filiformis DSM 16848 TaxID=1120981 RepID=A0A286EE22_9NEIS|nr:SEL1-like repeat protein [Alysiella filiformis]QMT30928.1 SEL1-like repeat protein [Alysiella filiformis]UBQ56085.1 SEL1-like repeat protein [Alysiella filiformis DSM 16848]SOD69152.1 Sel1 repeat-containing protein [Alysiella filiformis DSM 16848]
MKLKTFFLAVLLASGMAQAQSFSEKQVYDYRVNMAQAGELLKQNQSQQAFAKILPFAQQGFAEAQYVLATMYHDGEGVAQDLAQAKHWYTLAAQQQDNQAVADLAREGLSDLP